MVKDLKVARFYVLLKIHDVPGRSIISNCRCYTEKISSFSGFYLKPLALAVKSDINNANNFLKKCNTLPNLSDDIILCTIDHAGLYLIISQNKGLPALWKWHDLTLRASTIF